MVRGFLDPEAARRYYDWFGAKQDTQSFYEDAALDELREAGKFASARSVCEFGCGTGRLAENLLNGPLPASARYAGCDISGTMIALARQRLARHADRVTLWQSDAEPDLTPGNPPFDRIVAAYVFDLLSPNAITTALIEMRRCLVPGGLLCSVGLTQGSGVSGMVSRIWGAVHRLNPMLVGGCRPLSLRPYLDPENWYIDHDRRLSAWGVPSEVLVAVRL